jgi:succinate dehydrogenase / fumarate reductase cytochrome b subunit
MARKHDQPRSGPAPGTTPPEAQKLKDAIDTGQTGDKVDFYDPAVSPLGTDAEAAGTPNTPAQVTMALHEEVKKRWEKGPAKPIARKLDPGLRPVSPNIQIYRPQLTSVLSIANRITGALLSLGAIGLVVVLIAAASGPEAYGSARGVILSWVGQIILLGFTFAFFLHLCGGIRHLVWDTVHGFELRSIYVGGWLVVAASVGLTLAAWTISLFVGH